MKCCAAGTQYGSVLQYAKLRHICFHAVNIVHLYTLRLFNTKEAYQRFPVLVNQIEHVMVSVETVSFKCSYGDLAR